KCVIAHSAIETHDLLLIASIWQDRVKIGTRRFVVRLDHTVRYEIDERSVVRPTDVALVEIPLRDLLLLRPPAWGRGNTQGPYVRMRFGIEITGTIETISSAIDDTNVARSFRRLLFHLSALSHPILFFTWIIGCEKRDGLPIG